MTNYKKFAIGFKDNSFSIQDFGDIIHIELGKLQIGWRK